MSLVAASDSVLDYIKTFIWPVVVAGFLAYFLWQYGEKIGPLIDRIRSVKALGTEFGFDAAEQQQAAGDEDAAEETLEDADVIDRLINDYEEALQQQQLQADEERRELVRQLVVKELQVEYERIYRVIFGSQIAALRSLRVAGGELPRTILETHLSQAKTTWTTLMQHVTPDSWLGYMLNAGLIEAPAAAPPGTIRITDKGMGFLAYIDAGSYPPRVF